LQVALLCLLIRATLKAFGLAFVPHLAIARNFRNVELSVPQLQHGATLLY
jgi:hypothetical protein